MPLNPTYYANDIVRTLGATTYGLDVIATRQRTITTSQGTSTQHFDDSSDSPAWTTPGDGTHSRNITGPSGDLIAVRHATGDVAIQLTNLHGDVLATTTTNPATDKLVSTFESTEFGAPRSAGDVGQRRYSWLGGKARAADNPSGVILMGVRLYNPASGRFLSVDPIAGGNPNPYVYPVDPVNVYDLDGRLGIGNWFGGKAIGKISGAIRKACQRVLNPAYAIGCSALVGAAAGLLTQKFLKKDHSAKAYTKAAVTGALMAVAADQAWMRFALQRAMAKIGPAVRKMLKHVLDKKSMKAWDEFTDTMGG